MRIFDATPLSSLRAPLLAEVPMTEVVIQRTVLLTLPPELLTRIFTMTGESQLSLVNRAFFEASREDTLVEVFQKKIAQLPGSFASSLASLTQTLQNPLPNHQDLLRCVYNHVKNQVGQAEELLQQARAQNLIRDETGLLIGHTIDPFAFYQTMETSVRKRQDDALRLLYDRISMLYPGRPFPPFVNRDQQARAHQIRDFFNDSVNIPMLRWIEDLECRGLPITILPEEIARFPDLRCLDLRSELHCSRTCSIQSQSTHLVALPSTLSRLEHLEKILIDYPLKTVPANLEGKLRVEKRPQIVCALYVLNCVCWAGSSVLFSFPYAIGFPAFILTHLGIALWGSAKGTTRRTLQSIKHWFFG